MRRTRIVYDDVGAAVGVLVAGREHKMDTYFYQAKHGAKVQCKDCGQMNKASRVDRMGWMHCMMCGHNVRVTK